MRKIRPPKCTACNSGSQEWESERWPDCRICYQCVRALMTFLVHNDLLQNNPFAVEFASGVFKEIESNHGTYINVQHVSKYESSASGNTMLRIPEDFKMNG